MVPVNVLFHVGPHKTGTTTLQYAFNFLRPALMRRRILYPKGLHASGAHHVLAWQILKRPLGFLGFERQSVADPSVRLADWVDQAVEANCDKLLLSAEDFSLLSREDWTAVLDALRSSDDVASIAAILISRDPYQMARSAYGTLVMFGENRPFDEIKSVLLNRFETVLTKLENLTGRNGVFDERVQFMFESISQSGNLVEEFCAKALGISGQIPKFPVLNASHPIAVIEAVRQWNIRHCPGVTVDDDTGDFPPEVFSLDPDINIRRVDYLAGLVDQR